jgi:hypothetical protein
MRDRAGSTLRVYAMSIDRPMTPRVEVILDGPHALIHSVIYSTVYEESTAVTRHLNDDPRRDRAGDSTLRVYAMSISVRGRPRARIVRTPPAMSRDRSSMPSSSVRPIDPHAVVVVGGRRAEGHGVPRGGPRGATWRGCAISRAGVGVAEARGAF